LVNILTLLPNVKSIFPKIYRDGAKLESGTDQGRISICRRIPDCQDAKVDPIHRAIQLGRNFGEIKKRTTDERRWTRIKA